MIPLLMAAVAVHVLAGVFWAGVTFVQARTGGVLGLLLLGAQLGAAALAVITGGYMWSVLHRGQFGPPEQTLALGAAAALLAAAVQGIAGATTALAHRRGTLDEPAARRRIATAQHAAAALLAVTIVCMATARSI